MKKIILTLVSQGVKPDQVHGKIDELIAGGVISSAEYISARSVAAVLIAITAPHGVNAADHVTAQMNLVDESGQSLCDALQQILSIEPFKIDVAQISVCQSFPWVKIKKLDGSCAEFTAPDFKPSAFRTEAVITGGLVSALAMKLKFETASGWVKK